MHEHCFNHIELWGTWGYKNKGVTDDSLDHYLFHL